MYNRLKWINRSEVFITKGDPEDNENGAEFVYRSYKGPVKYRIKGILFKPAGEGLFPAVIVSHGKMGCNEDYSKIIAREMVRWGLVVIATNYTHGKEPNGLPGIPGVDMGAHTANILRAHKCYDILAQLGFVDINRVAAHGHSMGAFVTAALVGSYPGHFLVASHTAGGVNDANYPPYTSTEQAKGIRIPYQLHHGTADTIVPIDADRVLDKILTETGTVHELVEYKGKTHSDVKFDGMMFERVRAWYSKHGLFTP